MLVEIQLTNYYLLIRDKTAPESFLVRGFPVQQK